MSKIVIYYKLLIMLCNTCGRIVQHESLRDNLDYGVPPSPRSKKVFRDNHQDDHVVLDEKINAKKAERKAIGRSFVRLSRNLGTITEAILSDKKEYVDFCDRLMMREEDCDFRNQVRRWSRAELRKIRDNASEPDKPLSIPDFLDKYDSLLEDRKKKKRKRQKK